MKFQSPRGTVDILPKDTKTLEKLLDISKKQLEAFSFEQILTPIFESTDLFKRSVGESTDIVNKEMYTFLDRSERPLTLRPEATAGIMRAYVENGLSRNPKPVKLWTFGPMFRYERPQEGRTRQFHQIDVEVIGDSSISCEAESIFIISNILEELGIEYRVDINTLGDSESKKSYKEYFMKYVKGFLGDVCEDCQRRYEQNPLRMLDCKVKEDQEIYAGAKKPIEFLSESSIARWEELKNILGVYKESKDRKIKNIVLNPNLVRGLDYYNDFVFEIVAKSEKLNSNMAIGGGGRFDNLIETLGGEPTPGFGFALGVERILMVANQVENLSTRISIISNQDDVFDFISKVTSNFDLNISFDISFKPKKINKQLEQAIKKGCKFAVFYLESEKESNTLKIKDLDSREEFTCHYDTNAFIDLIKSRKEGIKNK